MYVCFLCVCVYVCVSYVCVSVDSYSENEGWAVTVLFSPDLCVCTLPLGVQAGKNRQTQNLLHAQTQKRHTDTFTLTTHTLLYAHTHTHARTHTRAHARTRTHTRTRTRTRTYF